MNLAWNLPRPKPDHYKGGMPLYCEDWLIDLAKDILQDESPRILNVFCGMNKYGTRVDLNPEVNPNILGDIHELSSYLSEYEAFDVIEADPPYSDEETDKLYSKDYPDLKYKKWTSECSKFLIPGGLFIIYHKYAMKNPDPKIYKVVKRVAIFNRTGHLLRAAIYFRKKGSYHKRPNHAIWRK